MLMWEAPKLGLKIRELALSDMENMRALRNEESIRKMHIYQKEISSESQIAWWNNLDKKSNLYLGLFHKDLLIGVVNLKDIDLNNKVAEAGAFIHPSYQGSGLIAVGSYSLMTYGFGELGLERIVAKVLSINESALKYNLSLGFRIIETKDEYHSIEVTFNEFMTATKRMAKLFDTQISRLE